MAESLWAVADQAQRLAELTSQDAPAKEAPLRRDVRSLGRLLGVVLHEQVGAEFFAAVEELRTLAISHRELHAQQAVLADELPDEHELMGRAREIVGALDLPTAYRLIK